MCNLYSMTATVDELRRVFGAALPAVVVSADHTEEVAAAVRAAGCEMLRKPVRPATLRALMAHLLAAAPALAGFERLEALVIARSPTQWDETLMINKGSSDGVAPDDAVITGEGLKTLDAVRDGFHIDEIDASLESFERDAEGRGALASAS